jgi:putative transcriptional regulator
MATHKDIFEIKHNNLMPEKGRILISEPFLQDSYFQRSVIILVEHNSDGTMGFVVNKKTGLLVNDFFDELQNIPHIPIYLGGPVSSERLFFIHSLGNSIPGSVRINDNLYFDGDFDSLVKFILSGQSYEERIKFFLGYSGWSKDQLKNEIDQNSWLVSKQNNNNVITAEDESFWKFAVSSIGGSYKTWINFPKDPILN